MAKEALVVPRDVLFRDKSFQGFLHASEFDYLPVILNNICYHQRGDELERNANLQQIIPYVWIVDIMTKKVFAYKRANSPNYAEVRLRNKWSCGIGGHIEREDSIDPIHTAMMRELKEEVRIKEYGVPRIIGYLKDESDSVGLVHFGVVALLDTPHEVSKGDDEMDSENFGMFSIDEFERMIANPDNELEGWSRLSWPFVKNYLTYRQ